MGRPDAELPKLVAQRVAATVKRHAEQLVRVETEREAFITTPEHPFATPRSGWIPAARLAAGDSVISAKFGSVRVLAVQSEKPPRPAMVFNLSVEPSHAYLVGTEQLLVHNVNCGDPGGRGEENDETARAADADSSAEPEHLTTAGSESSQEDALARNIRALQAADDAIAALEQRLRSSPGAKREIEQDIRKLKDERRKIKRRIDKNRATARRRAGVPADPQAERLLRLAEADHESARTELESAENELRELEARPARSEAERKLLAERKAALERKIRSLRLERDSTQNILNWEKQFADLDHRSPIADEERPAIETQKAELRAKIKQERHRRRGRDTARRRREDPERGHEQRESKRRAQQQRYRSAPYLADRERSPDALERMEKELTARHSEPGSESRAPNAGLVAERVETLQRLVALRRSMKNAVKALWRARQRREALLGAGHDTSKLDRKIAYLSRFHGVLRTEAAKLRATEILLGERDAATRAEARREVGEARLGEIERELTAGDRLDERRLDEIQRELEAEPLDEEFFEEIWREVEAQEAGLERRAQDEAEDVDALLLRELADLLESPPSPQRGAQMQSGLQRLQQELREERTAAQNTALALAHQSELLRDTLARPGSSHRAADTQRLAEVTERRAQLQRQWRARLQHRLDVARQQLQSMRLEGSRDPAAEAALAQQIALLEHELNNPIF
jgi:hypothetical protein